MLFAFLSVMGQDTAWYNIYWIKTTKDKAWYFRLQSRDSVGFKVTDYYKNGGVQMTGYSLSRDSLFRAGDFRYYDEKGQLIKHGKYVNNEQTGTWSEYYSDGQLYNTKNYKDNGKLDGPALYYYPDGKLKRSEEYSNGLRLSGRCYTNAGADTLYFPEHEMPEYKGGQQKMIKFLTDNLHYPPEAAERRIQGTVYVKFVVDQKGRVKDPGIFKGVNVLLNTAAIEVVSMMPRWKPGRIEGKPVRIEMILPISFKLD